MRLISAAGSDTRRGVVMTLVALGLSLYFLGIPCLTCDRSSAKPVAAEYMIELLMKGLGLYKLDMGTYPSTEWGLIALRVAPEGVAKWAGPYLAKDVPLDPWGRQFLYKYPGDHGEDPDLRSLGPDGIESEDDVVSWQ
jgi:general secretion pathway protein G